MLQIFQQYYPIRNLFFVLGEGVMIFFSIIFSAWMIRGNALTFDWFSLIKLCLVCIVLQTCLYYRDLYDFKVAVKFKELGLRLLQALGGAAVLLAGIYFAFPQAMVGRGVFEFSLVILILLIVSWRYLYSMVLYRGLFNERVMIFGSGELSRSIVAEIRDKIDCGYSIALNVRENIDPESIAGIVTVMPNLDGQYNLAEKANALGIKKIIVALEEKRGRMPIRELLQCRLEGVKVIDGNSFFEMLTGRLIVKNLNPAWLIFSEGFEKSSLQRFLKRMTDIALSTWLLIMLSPLLLVAAILIKIDSHGPVLFSQERVGRRGRPYNIYKFRSMVSDAEKSTGPVWAEVDDPRITRVGRVMRKMRFDELPQLWNVLKGEMSLVGPRPERQIFVSELEKTIPYYNLRWTVKPGVTGWAQINYSYGASVEDAIEKLNFDLFYIKNISFLIDFLIILRTIKIVLFSRGAR